MRVVGATRVFAMKGRRTLPTPWAQDGLQSGVSKRRRVARFRRSARKHVGPCRHNRQIFLARQHVQGLVIRCRRWTRQTSDRSEWLAANWRAARLERAARDSASKRVGPSRHTRSDSFAELQGVKVHSPTSTHNSTAADRRTWKEKSLCPHSQRTN